MDSSIKFGDRQPIIRYSKKLRALKKSMGVIKHECNAIDVNGIYKNSGVTLKPGNLIQFIPKYQKGERHFKIWNFTDSMNYFKNTRYTCSKNDYLVVTMKLWPYIFALTTDSERIKFTQNVYSREFNMKMLKLGSEILIQMRTGADIQYYEFIVTHNGAVNRVGTGYYIGLRLKNDQISLPADLKRFSQNYEFGGTGITVSAYWIMQNLYKEQNSPSIQQPLRKRETTVDQLCCCQPQTSNCCFILRCTHKFCRTFLTNILINQLKHVSRVDCQCPECFEKVDESEIKYLVGDMKPEVDLIKNHSSDSNKTHTTYTVIHDSNTRSKQNNRVILNNQPFQCIPCEENISINNGVILSGCQHSLCFACCKQDIGKQLAMSQTPACSICQKVLKQFEVDMIIMQVNVLNGNRTLDYSNHEENVEGGLKKSYISNINNTSLKALAVPQSSYNESDSPCHVDISFDCIVCDESVDCVFQFILSKCKHEICRKCLYETISTQISLSKKPKCPICIEYIDQIQLSALGFPSSSAHASLQNETLNLKLEIEEDLFEKCRTCRTRADIHLALCRHSFCRKCVQEWMMNQALDPNEIYVTCPVCNSPIADSDIAQYVSEEIFALFKIKIKAGTTKSIDHFTLNDQNHHRVVLASRETRHQHDVKVSVENAADIPNDIKNLVECLICEEKNEDLLIQHSQCDGLLCMNCASTSILIQIEKNLPRSCPICRSSLDESQYFNFKTNALANLQQKHELTVDRNHEPNTSLRQNNDKFECTICEKNINTECRVFLANCGHSFCRNCISDIILQQSEFSLVPNCPLCQTAIAHGELIIFDSKVHNIVVEQPLDHDSYVKRDEVILHNEVDPDIDEIFFCVICEGRFEMAATKVLSFCQDRFCRFCITKAINDQTLINKQYSCPLCGNKVCAADISDLCSSKC